MKDLQNKLIKNFWILLPVDLEAKKENRLSSKIENQKTFGHKEHLVQTAQWLCRAQDSGTDNGVSRAYKASRYKGHGPYGWQPSYPETTGYIIPTMFALADVLGNSDYKTRAIKMADWEIDVQLSSGAVMGSVVTAPPSPAVFNTGQVIFGWLAAYHETKDNKYLMAAKRAGDYLISVQDAGGSFKKGDSKFARGDATTYNTRVAWALAELGSRINEGKYIEGACKNIDYALRKQSPNGWFADNCLNDPQNPLLHTIVYAIRGILETGILLDHADYRNAAIKALNALLKRQRKDGGVPGRLNKDWESHIKWDCLTGDAQVSIAWLRVNAITRDDKYKTAAGKAIDFIKRTQSLDHQNPGIRGGVKGSFPFDGEYGRFELLNWAAKFFCDALMLFNDEALAAKGIKG